MSRLSALLQTFVPQLPHKDPVVPQAPRLETNSRLRCQVGAGTSNLLCMACPLCTSDQRVSVQQPPESPFVFKAPEDPFRSGVGPLSFGWVSFSWSVWLASNLHGSKWMRAPAGGTHDPVSGSKARPSRLPSNWQLTCGGETASTQPPSVSCMEHVLIRELVKRILHTVTPMT